MGKKESVKVFEFLHYDGFRVPYFLFIQQSFSCLSTTRVKLKVSILFLCMKDKSNRVIITLMICKVFNTLIRFVTLSEMKVQITLFYESSDLTSTQTSWMYSKLVCTNQKPNIWCRNYSDMYLLWRLNPRFLLRKSW